MMNIIKIENKDIQTFIRNVNAPILSSIVFSLQKDIEKIYKLIELYKPKEIQ